MQQDTAKMQGDRKLRQVRSFPFGAHRTDIHHVEKLIIDKYLGIPYKHRGREMTGLDCWGFLKCVYADLGFRLFDIEDLEYGQAWGLRNNLLGLILPSVQFCVICGQILSLRVLRASVVERCTRQVHAQP